MLGLWLFYDFIELKLINWPMTMKLNTAVNQMQLVSDAQIFKYFIVLFEYLFIS